MTNIIVIVSALQLLHCHLIPDIPIDVLFSNCFNLSFPSNLRDQVPHTHKTKILDNAGIIMLCGMRASFLFSRSKLFSGLA
jgi:hypothetical protein